MRSDADIACASRTPVVAKETTMSMLWQKVVAKIKDLPAGQTEKKKMDFATAAMILVQSKRRK